MVAGSVELFLGKMEHVDQHEGGLPVVFLSSLILRFYEYAYKTYFSEQRCTSSLKTLLKISQLIIASLGLASNEDSMSLMHVITSSCSILSIIVEMCENILSDGYEAIPRV